MGMISDLLTRFERLRSRRWLLRLDEGCLADIGYSRALLEEGVGAWPWRMPGDTMARLGRFRIPDAFRRSHGAKQVPEPMAYSRGRRQGTLQAAALLGIGRNFR
jgi:hypothetical protein